MSRRNPRKPRDRDRQGILYDILCSILRQESKGAAKITRVQNEVNLPSDRLRKHLREMAELKLVRYGSALSSTDKGRRYVSEYRKILQTLKQFGLSD